MVCQVHLDKFNISSFGHYIAFVKTSSGWVVCDDAHVVPVGEEIVLQQRAYVLFYDRTRCRECMLHTDCDADPFTQRFVAMHAVARTTVATHSSAAAALACASSA